MKARWKQWKSAGVAMMLAAVGLCLGAGQAHAANPPATLDIEVTVIAPLSVEVNGLAISTQTVAWSVSASTMVSPSTVTVTNNSAGTSEIWELSASPNSIDQIDVHADWTLETSTLTQPGQNQFALQAVFGSSMTAASGCPIISSTDWNQGFATAINTTPTMYQNAPLSGFMDTSLNVNGTPSPDCMGNGIAWNGPNNNCQANGDMFMNSQRALCWRVLGPSSVTNADPQVIQLFVTAANP
jgi:hypothetical protein